MPQHPAQRVHGACLIPDTCGAAIRGIGHEGIHVHQHIGAFGALIGAGTLAGAGKIVLQAEHREALQIVRGSVDCAVRSRLCQLRIITVLSGTAIQTGLPGIEAADRAVNVLQRKAVHGRSLEQPSAAVSGLLEIFHRVGEIRDCTAFLSGFAGFIRQDPAGRVIRPLHSAILEIISVEKAHLIPDMPGFIKINRQDLNGRILYEIAQVFTAVIGFSRLGIHAGKHAGFGGNADIGTGSGIGRFLLLFLRICFLRESFRCLRSFFGIFCLLRISGRLFLHGLLRFIHRGFFIGSSRLCGLSFR